MKKTIYSLFLILVLMLISWDATAQVTVAGSATGNGSYSTLGAAIAAIPLTGQSENNITVEISASTTETPTITIGNGNWATLKIYPTVSTLSCSSANISLNGAKNVTIDGRVNQTGTPAVGDATSLILSSTSTSIPVILFDNDAQNNIIKYCTIKIGALPNTTGGIYFGDNASITNGNGNNVIDHNKITSSGSIFPVYAIRATGSTSYSNKGNQITNNEFTNFMAAGSPAIGILILGNATANINDNYTISGNSMYGNVVTGSGGNRYFMQIGAAGNGGSHTITGNFIGGNSALCGGSKMTKSGSVVSHFIGIQLGTTPTGTSLIQDNTIQNISWTTSVGTQNFTGISVGGSGDATISGNVIGDNITSATDNTASSIVHSYTGSSNASFNGINISTTGTVTCQSNQIGSIRAYNGGTGGTGVLTFNGINKSGAGTITISNNIVGSLTASNSINIDFSNTTLKNQNATGINFTGTGTATINNNTIANLTNKTSGGNLYGINLNGTGSTVTANANFIHSNTITSATTATNWGIWSNLGSTTVTNNIMILGDNNSYEIRGIGDAAAATSVSAYHNTVSLSGAPTTLALNSACLFSQNTANIRNYKNNILVNARSNNGATGIHYALNMTSGGTVAVDANDYIASGTGGALGNYGGSDITTLPIVTSNDVNSMNVDPAFANVGGKNAIDYKSTNTSLAGLTGTGVTTDYEGTTRTAATMGAYFIPTIVPVSSGTVNSGDLTLSGSSQIEVAAGAELNLNSVLPAISKIILAPTAKLTMGANTINAANGVIFESDATGTATLLGNAAVSNATVQQYLAAGRNWYISPSVSAGTATMLSLGDSVVVWNEPQSKWDKVTSNLLAGRGYIQTAVSGHGTSGTVNFTGTTNAGDITTAFNLTRTGVSATSGFNLVGNPYPSYLRWSGTNSVIADVNNSGIGTSFWYRTKSNADAYIFVTHNGTSGYTIPVDQTPATTITGIIPPMQAFWVRVNSASTTMKFTNAMRLHADDNGNRFKAPENDVRQRLRLQLTNGSASDEALIYFDKLAANSFDNYDSPKMFNNSTKVPDLYTKAGSEKLVINGLTTVTDNMTLPLGFTLKAAASGLTLKVSELSNFAVGTKVYLLDNDQNTQTELLPEIQYTFNTTTAISNNESRFSLLFRAPGVTTGIEKAERLNAQVFVNAANQIVIVAPEKSNYAIYNAMGQQVANGFTTSNYQTSNIKLAAGMYVVQILDNGKELSTRVIVK